MFLILSGSYISNEMQSEFGRIPPVFLPLAGKPLLEYQIKISEESDIFVALPSDYNLSAAEADLIKNNGLRIIRVDHNKSLFKSITYCLNYLNKFNDSLQILFGDTLVPLKSSKDNIIGVSNGLVGFHWASLNSSRKEFVQNEYLQDESMVLNGFLQFESASIIRDVFSGGDDDFIGAINKLLKLENVALLEMENWLDFGHLHSYFLSRKNFTSERSFNSLVYQDGFFTKSAKDKAKILAEKNWFESLQKSLQIYVPVIHTNKNDSYAIEYLYNLPINELYLNCRLGDSIWGRIINSCFDFLGKLHSSSSSSTITNSGWNLATKTANRISSLPMDVRSLIDKAFRVNGESFESIVLDANDLIGQQRFDFEFVHGDFCFSNILYDFRSNRIKVIDPRGCDFDGQITPYGDPLYDYAKFAHSCIGKYDDIVAERYNSKLLLSDSALEFIASVEGENISNLFIKELEKRNIPLKAIYGYMVHIFLSMIPLHCDSVTRQLAFAVNALRLLREAREL